VTFLDSSVIIDMLERIPDVVEYVEDRSQPYLTSSLCVFEVIDGEVGSGSTDVAAVRQEFGGVCSLDLDEQIAVEAERIQDRLMDDGERMAARDLLTAATAQSTGDELIVIVWVRLVRFVTVRWTVSVWVPRNTNTCVLGLNKYGPPAVSTILRSSALNRSCHFTTVLTGPVHAPGPAARRVSDDIQDTPSGPFRAPTRWGLFSENTRKRASIWQRVEFP
jgi:Predicted nucleic acid-binding protein, contains PIN domain